MISLGLSGIRSRSPIAAAERVYFARNNRNRVNENANAKELPPKNVANTVTGFPWSRRRSPYSFIKTPVTIGARIKLIPRKLFPRKIDWGTKKMLTAPVIAPIITHPKPASSRFLGRVLPNSSPSASQPPVIVISSSSSRMGSISSARISRMIWIVASYGSRVTCPPSPYPTNIAYSLRRPRRLAGACVTKDEDPPVLIGDIDVAV